MQGFDITDLLEEIAEQAGNQAAQEIGEFVTENAPHLLQVPKSKLRTVLNYAAKGNDVQAEIELYRSLSREQRREYRAALRARATEIADAQVAAVVALQEIPDRLSRIAATALNTFLTAILASISPGMSEQDD